MQLGRMHYNFHGTVGWGMLSLLSASLEEVSRRSEKTRHLRYLWLQCGGLSRGIWHS